VRAARDQYWRDFVNDSCKMTPVRLTPLWWRPRGAIRHCKRVAQTTRCMQLQRRTRTCEAAADVIQTCRASAYTFNVELESGRSMRIEEGISSKVNNGKRVVLLQVHASPATELKAVRKERISSKCEKDIGSSWAIRLDC
jgi:hypothetical protein